MAPAMLSDLLAAVRHRLEVVADDQLRTRDPQAHLQKLKEAAAQLDALVSALPSECDPQLRHFLQRQSYAKALDWLQRAVRGFGASEGESGE